MAITLLTSSVLEVVAGVFTLLTEYSGETNPNITFDAIFTVTDGLDALELVNIEIDGNIYLTDANGQATVTLMRGDYTANISFDGWSPQVDNFTILDQNINENITLVQIGSYDESYDDSYEK